ncbi:hypothetical protein LZ30DRAFT_723014 [Colletotrichum cereale]|nr:hypothetical protein LZ30DRAFT_723014 [Colletotrichum cereale]
MTPLFLGGKPNLLVDLVGVHLPGHQLIHHWIGRVAILEALLHAALSMGRSSSSQLKVSGYIVSPPHGNSTRWLINRSQYPSCSFLSPLFGLFDGTPIVCF